MKLLQYNSLSNLKEVDNSFNKKYGISKETVLWLQNWYWTDTGLRKYQLQGLDEKSLIYKDLIKFRKTKEYTLYRWVTHKNIKKEIELSHSIKLRSYYNNIEEPIGILDSEDNGGYIEVLHVPFEAVLFDSTLLPKFIPNIDGKGLDFEPGIENEIVVVMDKIRNIY